MGVFISELTRRNVFRVGAAYAIVSWLIVQVIDIAFPRLGLPDWTITLVLVLLLIGLPVALILAWAFELTPDGVKKTEDTGEDQSVPVPGGQKLNFVIAGALVAALGFIAYQNFSFGPDQVFGEGAGVDKSVAVLPFDDLSEGGDQEWFSDGLTEEILNSLARLPELRVISRTSSFHFRDQDMPLREIAERLNVAHIVEGSVRRSGDRLRVTAQLIRAADDSHIWTETYNTSSDDVFSVQEQVAEKVIPEGPKAVRQLWGRQFAVVAEGLAPDQVASFVEELKTEYEARLQEKEESTSWDSFSRQVLAEAEREAARFKLKAKQDAEVEATRMISEAKRNAQEVTDQATRRAQEITEKSVRDILAAANKKAQITESRARQLSQLMLIRAREDIQDHITGEVQTAYHKLNSLLDDMIGAARGIEAQWTEKTLELWGSPALEGEEDQEAFLQSGPRGVLAVESAAPPGSPGQAQASQEQRVEPPPTGVASHEPEALVVTPPVAEEETTAEGGAEVVASASEPAAPVLQPREAVQEASAPAVEEATPEPMEP
ncbi:MAG: hypothetical protein IID59_00005, partial [Proteobacteria bacterium]|nr:hypothetical protein [Pseudomonadota bacterium]